LISKYLVKNASFVRNVSKHARRMLSVLLGLLEDGFNWTQAYVQRVVRSVLMFARVKLCQ